jgi:hypothetical protein
MRILRRTLLALLAGIVLLLFFGRPMVWAEATLLMWDVAAGGQRTWWQDVTAPPQESPIQWENGEGDLYLPASQARAAMVLVPGAAVLGRDEPRLQAFARSLSRAGFAVLVPELPEVRQLILSRADGDRVASAMRQLNRRFPDLPLGVAAISYAAAPAIIAAIEHDLASKVAFVSPSAAIATPMPRYASSPRAPSGQEATAASFASSRTPTAAGPSCAPTRAVWTIQAMRACSKRSRNGASATAMPTSRASSRCWGHRGVRCWRWSTTAIPMPSTG